MGPGFMKGFIWDSFRVPYLFRVRVPERVRLGFFSMIHSGGSVSVGAF